MKLQIEKITGDLGIIHFIGIGGIGMSGIAEILHNLGYKVQGSDQSNNANVRRLASLGIKILVTHKQDNVKGATLIVKSTAIKDNNPEIVEAISLHIPIIKRCEMLAELMRLKISIAVAGTHGKTTTTSMIATLFDTANLHPTVINGGIIIGKSTNAYLGSGDFLIAEADESDATFIRIPSTIGIITNIDPEHLDFYGSFDKLKEAFRSFIENLPFYGFGVLCYDHPLVRELASQIIDRKIITYGIESTDAQVQAVNIKMTKAGSHFDVLIFDQITKQKREIKDLFLPMPGKHNVLNSLAAIAVAVQLKFSFDDIKKGIASFAGVSRRFTKVGKINNAQVIDDYAHHPEEIIATLAAARTVVGDNNKIIAVFQPHRYSRVRDLFSEFTKAFFDAEVLIVTDIYTAGELPIDGVTQDILIAAIKHAGFSGKLIKLECEEDLPSIISSYAVADDLIICMGAGNITNLAYNLAKETCPS